MKKIIALLLVLVFTFAFVGCNNEVAHNHNHDHDNSNTTNIASNTKPETKPIEKALAFSYEDDKKTYAENTEGVKTEGFKNTEKATVTTIEEAITVALKEKNIKSDSVNMFYDANAKVCKVVFSTEGVEGDCQTVYLDKEGKTILIVYGE